MADKANADDIRRNWHEQAQKVFAAEDRRDAYKRAQAAHWKAIEGSRHGPAKRKLDAETYRAEKLKLAECEAKISKLEFLIQIRRSIWDAMPRPKQRRPRRTVLVDGIRTKLEYA